MTASLVVAVALVVADTLVAVVDRVDTVVEVVVAMVRWLVVDST